MVLLDDTPGESDKAKKIQASSQYKTAIYSHKEDP